MIESSKNSVTVHSPKSGRAVTVRGAGALKGQLAIKKSVDLTKPIASQATKPAKRRERSLPAKP